MTANPTDRKVEDKAAARPEPLDEKQLDTARGGSLNAYFSKIQGEKQGTFKGG